MGLEISGTVRSPRLKILGACGDIVVRQERCVWAECGFCVLSWLASHNDQCRDEVS